LLERAELRVHEKDASLAVPDKLLFEEQPDGAGGWRGRGDGLEQLRCDGPVEPCQDMEVHAHPVRDVGEGGVAEHMVGKSVFAEDEEEEPTPLGERRCVEVEDDWNKSPDVGDTQRSRMEDGDGVGVGGGGRNIVAAGRKGRADVDSPVEGLSASRATSAASWRRQRALARASSWRATSSWSRRCAAAAASSALARRAAAACSVARCASSARAAASALMGPSTPGPVKAGHERKSLRDAEVVFRKETLLIP
jgi:hypothetical protein